MRRIIFYLDQRGRAPFVEFLERMGDLRSRVAIERRVDRLRMGNAGDVAPIGEGVSELRLHIGPGYRVYFATRGTELIVLLLAGDKSTQSRDIRLARTYWSDYLTRGGAEHG